MSLVVLSNQYDESKNILEPANKWRNYLTNPMVIKKNSQVAVSSVKIVKNGVFTLLGDFIFYTYFYKDYDNDADNLDRVIQTGVLDDGTETTIDNLASKLTDAIKFGFPYPNNLNPTTLVSSIFDSQTGEFTGVKYKIHTHSTLLDRVPTTTTDWTPYPEPDNDGATIVINANQEITATTNSAFNSLLYTKYPLNLKGGSFKVSVPATSGWLVGLTNPGTFEDLFFFSSKFNHPLSELTLEATIYNANSKKPPSKGARKQLTKNFIDYGVYTIGEVGGGGNIFLEIFYMTYDDEDPTKRQIHIIDYYTKNNAINNVRYKITAESQLEFIAEGEEMRIQITDSAGSTKVLVSETNDNKAQYNLKPILQECWNLHPIIGTTDTVSKLTVLKYDGIEPENYDIYDEEKIKKSNLLQRYLLNGKMTEYRRLLNITSLTMSFDSTYTRILNINEAGAGKGYLPTFILAPQDREITRDARGMETLGFNTGIVNTFAKAGTAFSINGVKANRVSSKSNLFVRLDNFTQLSYNAGLGRESKIIYALPRFSNSGEDTGSLFFEATEKTFIDLNNTDDILANDFDISIVQENETLADLNGKSIVVLYFRQKQ